MSERRTIKDEYGELTLRLSSRGTWIKESRTINGITFIVDKDKKTKDFLLALKAGRVNLRLNVMNDRTEISGEIADLPDEPEYMSDILQANLTNWLADIGMTGKERALDAMSTSAWRNKYHPIKDYLEALRWDKKDHLTNFLSHLTFSDMTDVAAQIFIKRWMIGAVAKIMEQGQNFMLVLDGKQGIGKSHLAKWLCPLPQYFLEGAVHPEDKDSYKRLMSSFIWEVGELEGTTRKADRAALKDFISRREVTLRVAYGRHDLIKPAAASLIGTINEDGAGFLNDPTGSRRYASVKIIDIDYDYCKIDIDQLWAQVFQMYQNGEAWELDNNERFVQEEINKMYEADSPIAELINQHFDIELAWSDMLENFTPSIEILGILKDAGLRGHDRANLMEISTVLKRIGLHKKRVKQLIGFYGVRQKSSSSIVNSNGRADYANF